MARVIPSLEEQAFIRERITLYEEEAPKELKWQAVYVREHRALPLYVGWTETLAIRADGLLIHWSTEGEWPGARELHESLSVNMALAQGAVRYPQLT